MGTCMHSLTYSRLDQEWKPEITMYCNADWALSPNRKSISGYIFLLAGGSVSWSSKKQSTVALSTIEAKYITTTYTAKQILWHQSLFSKLEKKFCNLRHQFYSQTIKLWFPFHIICIRKIWHWLIMLNDPLLHLKWKLSKIKQMTVKENLLKLIMVVSWIKQIPLNFT